MSMKIINKANYELQQLKKDCLNLGIEINNVFPIISKMLFGFYLKKNRFYHNLTHVLAVVKHCRKYAKDHENLLELILAAWFHDIIYAPRSHNNEALSARVFERIFLYTNMPRSMIARVKQYILDTKSHLSYKTPEAAILIDADLKILAATNIKYLEYNLNIQKEYDHLSVSNFKNGRIRFLKYFLAQIKNGKIYKYLPETYNKKAISNVKKELKRLTY